MKRTMQPGDRIRVHWGDREVAGVVTSVSGDGIHVDLTIEGAGRADLGALPQRACCPRSRAGLGTEWVSHLGATPCGVGD